MRQDRKQSGKREGKRENNRKTQKAAGWDRRHAEPAERRKTGYGGMRMPDAEWNAREEREHPEGNLLFGRNPVMEALRAGRDMDRLLVEREPEGSLRKIIGMAKDAGIPVIPAEKAALDRAAGSGTHQGVVAYVSSHEYSTVEAILEAAGEKGEDPFLVILDGLEDPHNLGAIMRTAEGAGAHGVIIPKRRSVGLTETVAKSSAGAIEYMPVARVTNIARTVETLKENGIWIAACDMGDCNYYEANLTGGIALVIGSEGFGISRLVKEKCDFTVSMPMMGKISSLNASCAAAVLLYEVRRQRDLAAGRAAEKA